MYQDYIKSVLINASKIAVKNFGKVSSTTKPGDNNQVLTETDLEIGKYIVSECQKLYPAYNIIDEEAGVIDKKSEYTWVIDPIDGTSNFANGIPTYGIMLGLLKEGAPIAGGVSLPSFDEIYLAEKGSGAYCNDDRIRVTDQTDLAKCLVAYGIDGHHEDPGLTRNETKILGDIILNIRNLRATNSVFDEMMVAQGKYGAALNKTSKIWDNVARQLIIEEAGGVYTDFYGRKIDYSNPLAKVQENFTYIAGASSLHKQLLGIINKNEPK